MELVLKMSVCVFVCRYLGLTPDDVGRIEVNGNMWKDRKTAFSAN